MGFFGDLAKSVLFGDNQYADEVVTEYNLRSDTEYSLIRAIDAAVMFSTDNLSITKAQGYRKGILDYVKKRVKEKSQYDRAVMGAILYCKKIKSKSNEYKRDAYEWFENNLLRIVNDG